MQAAEAKVQKILEGSKQFLVPHFQRPYSWEAQQWQTLWRDILELVEDPDSTPHFLGSIVTSSARSVPEGVEKRLVIDGQQRLTTLLVLLCVVRDRARERGDQKLADRAQDIITNRHEEGFDHFKLLPTQAEDATESDRDSFIGMVNSSAGPETKSNIEAARKWFAAKLRRADAPNLETLYRTITSKVTLVSIILDENDNPHRIFESLNGTGRPLSQADLIRNYFFMRLPLADQDQAYRDLWRPMQRRLGEGREDTLTDFVRHYLMRFIGVVREDYVYTALKARVEADTDSSALDHLRELARHSVFYDVLLRPEKAPSSAVRARLARINRLEVTVAYPFLLPLYADFVDGTIGEMVFTDALDLIENFIVRRHVCGVPTHGLNKTFAPLYEHAKKAPDFIEAVKQILSASPRGYPNDRDFRAHLASARLYGQGERRDRAKFLLERLETAHGHKEAVVASELTIEHVMPQTLTDVWKAELGTNWEEDHLQLLHTLGNLTLTNYNAELGNTSFLEKRAHFARSHIEMNRHFTRLEHWTADEIERRATSLSELAVAMWPYVGRVVEPNLAPTSGIDSADVVGTVPEYVRIRNESIAVQSWVDVAVCTIEAIAAAGDDELTRVIGELPRFVNRDPTVFRRSSRLRKLANGVYVETNLSATSIHRLCLQAVELAGLVEWSVSYRPADPSTGSGPDGFTPVQQLQQEFWLEARQALEKTAVFPVLRAPPARHWFEIPLGRKGFRISLTFNTAEKFVAVKVVFTGADADAGYNSIALERAAIEAELGYALQWDPHPDKTWRTVKVVQSCEPNDRASWPATIDWLADRAARMHRAFGRRIADLGAPA